jgi:DNA-binding XRE family transcriptional regulator
MTMRLTPNGARIKELRTRCATELPQKKLADLCNISERQLRRIENENVEVISPTAERIAKALKVTVEDIVFSAGWPKLVQEVKEPPSSIIETVCPETISIPRYTTAGLAPVSGAQELYGLAEGNMEIVPHVLVDCPPAQMAMIEECLSLLKGISLRRWSGGKAIAPDVHDGADFPETSRLRRLAELFVLLKGHDVRIVAAGTMIYHYPPGATAWLKGERTSFQLVIAFAPPRGEYEESTVAVPFDGGRDLVLPYNPF